MSHPPLPLQENVCSSEQSTKDDELAWTSIRCSSYFLLFCLNSKYLHAVYILVCITRIGHFIRYKFSYLFRQITKLANHLAAAQSIEACRHGEGDLLKFKASIRNGKR